jgi:hypothetical protein
VEIVQKMGLVRYTSKSVIDPKQFFREIQRTKEQGYAVVIAHPHRETLDFPEGAFAGPERRREAGARRRHRKLRDKGTEEQRDRA